MEDLVIADSNLADMMVLDKYKLDLAFGNDENNFVLTVDFGLKIPCGSYLYFAETEWGGTIDGDEIAGTGKAMELRYHGRTWHGTLAHSILCPDAGMDYLSYSGDLNDVIWRVIDRQGLEDVFVASDEPSGITVSGSFDRYTDAYAALSKLCRSKGYKLKLLKTSGGKVMISADKAATIELDSDRYQFDIKKSGRFINHLVCLGSGELKDRTVVNLYANSKKQISRTRTFAGVDEIAEVYDYNNADSEELIVKGTEKFQECLDSDLCELTVGNNMNLDIGDTVHAVNVEEGIEITATVENVVITSDALETGETLDVSYEIGNIRMGG